VSTVDELMQAVIDGQTPMAEQLQDEGATDGLPPGVTFAGAFSPAMGAEE
jgi:hypothetical protein